MEKKDRTLPTEGVSIFRDKIEIESKEAKEFFTPNKKTMPEVTEITKIIETKTKEEQN